MCALDYSSVMASSETEFTEVVVHNPHVQQSATNTNSDNIMRQLHKMTSESPSSGLSEDSGMDIDGGSSSGPSDGGCSSSSADEKYGAMKRNFEASESWQKYRISFLDLGFSFMSIILFLADNVTDFIVAIVHLMNGKY